MKKNSLVLAIFAVAVLFSTNVSAQKFSKLDKSPMDAASFPTSYKESNKIVKVVYSRPQLKGRTVASLAPAEKVWRTGANEATAITFYKDVTFGGKAVISSETIGTAFAFISAPVSLVLFSAFAIGPQSFFVKITTKTIKIANSG
mgnify:CR=1 FL=1